MAFETPHLLGISSDPPQARYGYFLEYLHILNKCQNISIFINNFRLYWHCKILKPVIEHVSKGNQFKINREKCLFGLLKFTFLRTSLFVCSGIITEDFYEDVDKYQSTGQIIEEGL